MMGFMKRNTSKKLREAGNIFVIIFGAVALVAALNYAINLVIKGPLSSAVGLSRTSGTDAKLLAHARVILSDAVLNQANAGDLDGDGFVEPRPYDTAGTLGLTGGGAIPAVLGLDDDDAWGSQIGYCVWDHGGADTGQVDGGTTVPNRLQGAASDFTAIAIALVSPGKNRRFESECFAIDGFGSEGFVNPAGSDDVVLALSYAEATETVGGTVSTIWQLSSGFDAAQSNVDIEISSVNPGLDPRNVSVSGDGEFIALRVRDIYSNTASGAAIVANDPLRMSIVSGAGEPANLPGGNIGTGNTGPLNIDQSACSNAENMTIRWDAATQTPIVDCGVDFATLDATIASTVDDITLSGGDLTATFSLTGGTGAVPATAAISSGQVYWEVTIGATSSSNSSLGVMAAGAPNFNPPTGRTIFETGVYAIESTRIYVGNGAGGQNVVTTFSPPDSNITDVGVVMGFALDADAGTLRAFKNGVEMNSGNPIVTGLSGSFRPIFTTGSTSATVTFNFGATAFTHTPPAGYTGVTQ